MLRMASMVIAGLVLSMAAMLPPLMAEDKEGKADEKLPIAAGPFQPTAESLQQFRCPEWFRDAKFGIWAHWGPQSVPRQGDWYARRMYLETDPDYKHHLETYGHPSKHGYKDIIPLWKAEKWDPDRLMDLYVKAGAKYFVSMGVHHDNFDLWNSKYHKWNAVEMGPHRDVVGQWKQAAQKRGLKFGVSEHLGASFGWFQSSHGADSKGPLAGVPYDGADPQWQELYHPKSDEPFGGKEKWYTHDARWPQEWYQRIQDLVDNYQPDLLYTDGGIPFGAVGRSMVAHLYNANIARHDGRLEAVYNCKDIGSGEFIPGAAVQDVERGAMRDINPLPWQTDTATADWFYSDPPYRPRAKPKTAAQVIRLLADIISKNGNLLLNVVQYPDGSLPPESLEVLEGMAVWMAVNSEAIHGTRPWKVYGEGPTVVSGGHFKEDFPFTADDIRFITKGQALYAIALGVPTKELRIKSLGSSAGFAEKPIATVTLLGSREQLHWTQQADTLVVQPPAKTPCDHAIVLKIVFGK
jgi:alpha-L-fucosidase